MAKNQEWLDSASDAQRNLLQDPSAAGIQELRNWASIAKQSREVQLGQLQMLRSEDAEEIYSEAFSSTPYGMYNEMVQLVRLRGPSLLRSRCGYQGDDRSQREEGAHACRGSTCR